MSGKHMSPSDCTEMELRVATAILEELGKQATASDTTSLVIADGHAEGHASIEGEFDLGAVARAAIRAMPQWQAIETAPKDGTEVILARGKRITAGAWTTWCDYYIDGVLVEAGEQWSSWDGGFTETEPPTHWMPLPDPASGGG